MTPSRPPRINETKGPGVIPGERRISWKQLLDKPTTPESAGIVISTLNLHAAGAAPLTAQRDETSAAILTVFAIKRNGVVKGYVGLDADDHLSVIDKNGTKVLADFDTDGTQNFAVRLNRDAAAAVLPFIAIRRQATLVGYLGADASDRLALIATDGTTVLGYIDNVGELNTLLRVKSPHIEGTTDSKSPHLIATTDTKSPNYLDTNGDQVLSTRVTGWGFPTGTLTRTSFDTSTVTLSELAERVAALITDAMGHGFVHS